MKLYASLIGPLLGLYYPLEVETEAEAREMMRTSRLNPLWHSLYSEEETDRCIALFGGVKLPKLPLDYDSHAVHIAASDRFRYIVCDILDGMLKGTNDRTRLEGLTNLEDYWVYDSLQGVWITGAGDSIKEEKLTIL